MSKVITLTVLSVALVVTIVIGVISSFAASNVGSEFEKENVQVMAGNSNFNLGGHTVFMLDGAKISVSNKFAYMPSSDKLEVYFNLNELKKLSGKQNDVSLEPNLLLDINGEKYLPQSQLAAYGLTVDIGWEMSSYTPVMFTTLAKAA